MAGPVNELKAKFGANASELLNAIKKLKTEMSDFAKNTSSSLKIADSGMNGFSSSINKLKSHLSGLGKADQFQGLTNALEAAQREFKETGSISENTMRIVRQEADRARQGISQLGNEGGQSLGQLENYINQAENEMTQLAGVNLNPVTGEINELGDASQDTAGELNDLGQAGDNTNLDEIGSDADNASGNLDELGDAAQDADNELSDLGGNSDLEDIINDAEDASNGMEDLENETDQASDVIDDLGDQDLNPLIDEIDEASDEIEDLGDQDLNPLIDDLDQAQDEVDDLGDEADETGNRFDGLKGKIMGLVGAYLGFEAIKEGAKLAGSAFIMANADMEVYENTLTTVLKSNEKAKEALNWANEFAAQTPFEIPEIVEATTRLSAYGMNAKDVMTDIGNMAAVMGTPLMQAVEAVADAQTGELERLKEFGITKQMLIDQAAKMGHAEVVNAKGQIVDQENFNKALFALMEERYKGGMATQAKTFKGLISNVQDGLGTMGRELGKPIFDKFKKGLESVVPLVSGVTELIKGNGKEASKIFTDAFGADKTAIIFSFVAGAKTAFSEVKNFIMGLVPTFQNIWTVFQNVGAVILPPLIVAFGAFMQILPPVLEVITGILAKFTEWSGFAPILSGIIAAFVTYKTTMTAIGIVQRSLALATSAYIALQNAWRAAMIMSSIAGGGLRGVMVGLRAAMISLNLSFLGNPIVLLVAALVGLGVAMVVAYNKSETFRNFVNSLWDSIKNAGQWIANFFTTTIPNALSSFGSWAATFFPGLWNGIVNGVVSFGSTVGTFFSNIWTGFINILNSFFTTVWGLVTSGFNFVVSIFQSVGSTISSVASSIWAFVLNAFTTGITNIMNVFSPLVEWFNVIWSSIKVIFLSVVLAIISLVTGNFSDLKFALTSIWQAIKNMFNATITAIKELAINIFTALKNTVMKVFETLKSGASTIWNAIKSTASSVWNSLKTTVVNAANSLKTGAVNAWNSLKSSVVNAANSLKTSAVNAWNNLKSGVVNAANALKNGAVNAWNSLKSSASSIVSNIKSTITNGFNNAKTAAVNAFQNMVSGVKGKISSVKSSVVDMKNNIISTIKGISLTQIGRNIINGLRDGITGAAAGVMKKARDIADNIKDTIKGALKINSPSRVMIGIGQSVGEGLEDGLSDSEKGAGKSAQSLTDTIYKRAEAGLKNTLQRVSEISGDMANVVNDSMNFNSASLGGSLYGESVNESRLMIEHLIDLANVPAHINQDQLKGMFMEALQDPRVQVAIDRSSEKMYGRVIRPQGGF